MKIYKFEEWGGEISIKTLEAEEKGKVYVTKGICGYKKNEKETATRYVFDNFSVNKSTVIKIKPVITK